MNLAEQFRKHRELRRKSVQQLAEAAGLSEEDIWKAESGSRAVALDSLIKIAGALACKLELVNNPGQQIIYEATESPDPGIAPGSVSDVEVRLERERMAPGSHEPFERLQGVLMLKGTRLSLRHLLEAFCEDLSIREIAAGARIPRTVIRGALRELATKVDHLAILPRQEGST